MPKAKLLKIDLSQACADISRSAGVPAVGSPVPSSPPSSSEEEEGEKRKKMKKKKKRGPAPAPGAGEGVGEGERGLGLRLSANLLLGVARSVPSLFPSFLLPTGGRTPRD